MVEQVGLMRKPRQHEYHPSGGNQQPGPQYRNSAPLPAPAFRLLLVGCREPMYRARMQQRNHVWGPLSLGDEAECSLHGVMVLQAQVVSKGWNLRAEVFRPAHIGWGAGNGGKDALVQCGGLS